MNKGSITTPHHDDGSSTAVSGADGDVSTAAGHDVTGMNVRCGGSDNSGNSVDDAGDDAAAAAAAAGGDGGIVYEIAEEPLEEATDPTDPTDITNPLDGIVYEIAEKPLEEATDPTDITHLTDLPDLDTAASAAWRSSAAAPPLSPAAAAVAAAVTAATAVTSSAAATAAVADMKVVTAENATEDTTEGETENAEGIVYPTVEVTTATGGDGNDAASTMNKGSITTPHHDDGSSTAVSGADGDVSTAAGHDVTGMNVRCGDWDDGGDGVDDAGDDAAAAAAAAGGDGAGGIVYDIAEEPLEEATDPTDPTDPLDLDTAAIEGLRFSAAAPPLSPSPAAAAAAAVAAAVTAATAVTSSAAVTASVADTKVATAEGATEDTTEEGETENAEGIVYPTVEVTTATGSDGNDAASTVNKGSITTSHDDGSSTAVSGADGDVSTAAGRDVTGMNVKCGGYGKGPSRTHSFTLTHRAAVGDHFVRCGIIDRASSSCKFDAGNHCASRTAGSSTAHHYDNADVKFTFKTVETCGMLECTDSCKFNKLSLTRYVGSGCTGAEIDGSSMKSILVPKTSTTTSILYKCVGHAGNLATKCVNVAVDPPNTHAPTKAPTKTPIDCVQGPWYAVDSCTEKCGGGILLYTRDTTTPPLHNGKECKASYKRHDCNIHPCPIDCEHTGDGWEPCIKTCGTGSQVQMYRVATAAKHGGDECPAAEQRTCNDLACPIDCKVSTWDSSWTTPPYACHKWDAPHAWYFRAENIQYKSRSVTTKAQHGGIACPTLRKEQYVKYPVCCPVDCEVSAWSKHGACSEKCGGGFQKHHRSIVVPDRCSGMKCPSLDDYAVDCNTHPCPIDCTYNWNSWSTCTKTCGIGVQSRTFDVRTAAAHSGDECPTEMDRPCNTQPCPIDSIVSAWSKYSLCSNTCGHGGGIKTKSRSIVRAAAFGGKASPTLTFTSTSKTCPACAAGKYKTSTCSGTCTAWTACYDGAIQLSAGSTTVNLVCHCSAGYISLSGITSKTCTACTAGKYKTGTGSGTCTTFDSSLYCVSESHETCNASQWTVDVISNFEYEVKPPTKKARECRQFALYSNDECEKTKAVEAPFATMDRTFYTGSWANTGETLMWTHHIFHEDMSVEPIKYLYDLATFKQYVTAQGAQYIDEVMSGDSSTKKALSKWPSEASKTKLQVQPNTSPQRIL
jgi:hypothetical protein